MKTIILHDYFESLEGGGKLSSILACGLQADIGCGFARPDHPFLAPTFPFFFKERHLFNLNAYSRLPLWRQFKLSRAFTQRRHFLKNYDLVIYSGFYTPLAVHQHRCGPNILYCHTPPRFIYDQRAFYLAQLPYGLRPALHAFIRYLQPRYEQAVACMDTVVTNSENVRQRIRHYLGKDALVVYPPCDTRRFVWQGQSDYYLSTARLDTLKQVDLIIQAFLRMPDKRLIVTSQGPAFADLKKLAQHAPHIHFTGWVSEQRLADLIGHAIATLYLPRQEDFGMSPLESMAAGKPVIGIAEGGLLESIVPEETGILLPPPLTVEHICEAVHKLTPQYALTLRQACEARAQQFRVEVFWEKMRCLL